MRQIAVLLALVAVLTTPLHAQRRCVKGIPCGNTCIAANKTCRVSAPAPQSPPAPTARPGPDSAPTTPDTIAAEARWLASSRGQVYYRVGCSGARKLSPANLVYFKTEEEAQKAGYRHSTARGC